MSRTIGLRSIVGQLSRYYSVTAALSGAGPIWGTRYNEYSSPPLSGWGAVSAIPASSPRPVPKGRGHHHQTSSRNRM